MARPDRYEWTDARILTALRLRDVNKMTASEIGQRLGVSRAAVCGMFKRVADDERKAGEKADG